MCCVKIGTISDAEWARMREDYEARHGVLSDAEWNRLRANYFPAQEIAS
jgi:hypothetical protein